MTGSRTRRALHLDRRALLRGALGGTAIAVALPALECMLSPSGTALADGTPLPKRFGIFFWGNGVKRDRWTPAATGPDWALTPELMPLGPVKKRVTVVTGMNNFVAGVDGHADGAAAMLTGYAAKKNSDSPKNLSPTAETIDQIAARTLGKDTPFKSLEIRISKRAHTSEGTLYGHVSFSGPNAPNEPERDPVKVYERLFTGFMAPVAGGAKPVADATMALRRSALDAVMADLKGLQARVGAADKARLEQHFDHVRAIESRLAAAAAPPAAPPTTTSCRVPTKPAVIDDGNQEQLAARMKIMSELVALTLACDRTRVFSIQFTSSVGLTRFPIPGFTQDQHQLTHDEPGDQPLVHQSVVFTMEQFATLVSTLDGVTEGAGTLLDRCAIFGATDTAEGREHAQNDFPMLLAGSAGGRLRMGIHHRSKGENSNKMLFSLLNAVGCNLAEFGEQSPQHDARVKQGCAEIEA